MRAWYAAGRDCWSSQLMLTEALRAASSRGLDPHSVDALLDRIALVLPTPTTFRRAAMLGPVTLRSLDALHIATALELVPELDGIVAYDVRVIDGATEAGVAVVTPR